MSSVLNDVKKSLNLEADYTAFDPEIMMHINGVFSTLNQIGIGPLNGFFIEDAATDWAEFMGEDPRFNMVKPYVYLRVRVLFDPPTTSFLLTAYQEQIKEHEWRLSILRDSVVAAPAVTVLDGGDAEGVL